MNNFPYSIFKLILLTILSTFFACKQVEKKQESAHKYTNSLVHETSPYLLQHAHNPVNWRPWSPEALKDAEKENKLVLVSIGYSSCHWCHVMEEETFEDEEVAKMMNENFISIKVDREERPDVDQVYMTALQLINDGNGGWPLNVITLPNGKPLYGGTYHTKAQWTQVLTKISALYKNDPKKATEYSDMVAEGIAAANLIQPSSDFESLSRAGLKLSVENWKPYWDMEQGGDQGSQKFMIPTNLDFLLDYATLSGDGTARSHVKITLDKMAQGGIYDHVGGGFFRYSTDPNWSVPHFEKMLYDNAQAISLYSKAYTAFNEPRYKEIVLETIDFLTREMKDPKGGYHAALDADSDGKEGEFYVWREAELKTLLKEDFDRFATYYNIKSENLWEDGKYVLRAFIKDTDFAKQEGISIEKLNMVKAGWKKILLPAREKRTRPRIDDKIITSWNALLIKGLVDAYKAFGERDHLDKAIAIYDFLMDTSYKNGRLLHTYKEGSQQKEGFLEDYAFLIDASLDLYGATFDTKYLELAQKINLSTEQFFGDQASGMHRYSSGEELIAKIIKTDDGVLPSPNAVMAHNLFRLGHILYDTKLLDKSKQMLVTMLPSITKSAPSFAHWDRLLLQNTYPYFEIAVVGKQAGPLIKELNSKYIPNTLIVGSLTQSKLPLFEGRYFEEGTYIYVCQNSTCKLPVETVERALGQMKNF